MFYFLHHYEIPAIQRRIRFSQVLLRNNNSQNLPPDPPQPESGDPPPQANPEMQPTQASNDSETGTDSTQGRQTENNDSANNAEHSTATPSDAVLRNDTATDLNHLESINSIDLEFMKRFSEIELWEEFPAGMTEGSTERNTERLSKYCNYFMMLLLCISAIVLIFTLSLVMLNLGKFGTRFGGYRIEKVGEFVS